MCRRELTRLGWRSASSGSSSEMPKLVEDENVGYARTEPSTADNQVSIPMQKMQTRTWRIFGTMTMTRR